MQDVTPLQACAAISSGAAILLDVRTREEWDAGHVAGSLHLPLDRLPAEAVSLDPDGEIYVICAHGIRSRTAAAWLAGAGFARVANVRFGIVAWPEPLVRG